MFYAFAIFIIAWGAILYAYIGFPIMLSFAAKLFGKEPTFPSGSLQPDSKLPRIAIVVAAFNEQAVIEEKLSNTWALDYPADRLELWIGSDGSSDKTEDILRECRDPRLHRILFPERRGKISVLNDLMSQIDAEIVVMSDANTDLSPDSIRELVKHFQDPFLGCVSGELSLTKSGGVSGEGIYWKYESWIKRSESKLGFLIGCNGGIFALRRELFTPLPASTIVEDFVMTLRIVERGYRVRFEPMAKATEPACLSAKAEMIRKIRIGAGGFQAIGLTRSLLNPMHGYAAFAYWGHKIVRWLVPFFFLSELAANIALWHLPILQASLVVQASGFLIALLASFAPVGVNLPRWTRPISYIFLMNYALFRGFFRFVFDTQRVTWDRAPIESSLTPQLTSNLNWKKELGGEMID